MSILRPTRRAAAALALSLVAVRAGAQASDAPPATIAADAYLNSAYVWRGVTFTNRPVVQADLAMTLTTRAGLLSGGVWGNAEPQDYRGAHDIRLIRPDRSGPAITALTTWFDLTHGYGAVAATAGVTSYWYPAITGAAAQFNTSELYGRLALTGPLSPRVAVYMDVEKVRGAYFEAAIGAPIPLASHPIALGATVGASAGQAVARNQSAYFAHDGLAFADLSAATTVVVGGVNLAPSLHVLLDRDAFTRVVELDGAARSVKTWFGLTASYAHAVPRPPRGR